MRIRSWLVLSAVSLTLAGRASPALAQEKLPVAYVDRGITNPAGTLTPEVQFDISHSEIVTAGFGGAGFVGFGDGTAVGVMSVGAAYAITDDLGVRVAPFALRFNDPDAQLAAAEIGFTYRFLRGSFEMGVGVDWVYQTTTNDMAVGVGQEIVPSLPMHIHFGHAARLDITPALPISTAGIYEPGFHDGTIAGHAFGGGNGGTTAGLDVPLNLAVQIVEQLHFDIGTGFNMTFNPVASAPGSTFGDFFALPFGFDLGIAVPGPRGPIFEMTPFFLWPALLVPGVQNGIDGVQSAFWETGINFRGYIYM